MLQVVALALNDMVKIDLGCHVDGYIAVSAHTVIVGLVPNPEALISGPQANVMHAAWTAAKLASRMIVPGNTNTQVSDACKKIAEAYGVNAIAGTVMHQMKRFVIGSTCGA